MNQWYLHEMKWKLKQLERLKQTTKQIFKDIDNRIQRKISIVTLLFFIRI